ncbi:MAG TPA: hypothetical protein VIK91_03435 [Nannocystis sp.]
MAALTAWTRRERHDTCTTNRDGVCVVAGSRPRGPVCSEPTPACHAHLARPDRWPGASLSGLAYLLPLPRAP